MKSIKDMLFAAIKAITVPGLGSSVLVPEQADRFIRVMEERTVLLGSVRRLTMSSGTRNIDRTGFAGRILTAPAPEGQEYTTRTDPAFYTNQLVAKKARGAAFISDEALQENIEREGFENTLVDMIATQAGIDLEELLLCGDTGSPDSYLALLDGWLKDAPNKITGSTTPGAGQFAQDNVEDMFEKMLLAVDPKYLANRAQWRFYVTFKIENDYRNVLRGRNTGLGDTAQTGAQPLFYKGIRVEEVPKMPAGTAWLTHVDNTVYGIRRDIEIEPDRVAGKDGWDFHVRVRSDADYEDENATVVATGYVGPSTP